MGKGYKGKNPRGGKGKADEEAEAEFLEQRRGAGQQSSNAGMMPPSDSDDEDEGPSKPSKPAGQSATAGMMPPSDSEGSSSDGEPEYLKAAPVVKKKDVVVERSAEDIRKDMERLEFIRKKREDDKAKRIAADGWDRFAPVTETNKAPGHYVPPKHDDDD